LNAGRAALFFVSGFTAVAVMLEWRVRRKKDRSRSLVAARLRMTPLRDSG
jgi:hypothetical protein